MFDENELENSLERESAKERVRDALELTNDAEYELAEQQEAERLQSQRHPNVDADIEVDPFLSDAEADADALASAGWGTDEDYGHFSDGEEGFDSFVDDL